MLESLIRPVAFHLAIMSADILAIARFRSHQLSGLALVDPCSTDTLENPETLPSDRGISWVLIDKVYMYTENLPACSCAIPKQVGYHERTFIRSYTIVSFLIGV